MRQNAFHCAATTSKPALVSLLKANGINPEFEDIHVASALGRLGRVKALLSGNPGLLNQPDMFGATPLYWCAALKRTQGRHEVAAFLLSKGADPNLKEESGRSALLCARQRKDEPMVELLVRHGAAG